MAGDSRGPQRSTTGATAEPDRPQGGDRAEGLFLGLRFAGGSTLALLRQLAGLLGREPAILRSAGRGPGTDERGEVSCEATHHRGTTRELNRVSVEELQVVTLDGVGWRLPEEREVAAGGSKVEEAGESW
jgi:hypothetical protein